LLSVQNAQKIDEGWGFTPNPTGGAYSALPSPIAGKGEGKERERGEGKRRGKGRWT